MTRHRTITGFVAVALLAVAATAATMRTHSPDGVVVAAGPTSSTVPAVDANEIPNASFDERWSAIPDSKTNTPEP